MEYKKERARVERFDSGTYWLLLSTYSLLGLDSLNPVVDQLFENLKRHRAVAQDHVVEFADVETYKLE